MQIRYVQQAFQSEAAQAVVDVFARQPKGQAQIQMSFGNDLLSAIHMTLWQNAPLSLDKNELLANIHQVQDRQELPYYSSNHDSDLLEFSLTMETGVGKTYTYIKTIFELHKAYGWSKYIVVVPSIAIREGVLKSFESTAEHFKTLYGEVLNVKVFNSNDLKAVEDFARERSIQVLIINMQAFNSDSGVRKILQSQEALKNLAPISILAATRPILILDEPQSIEGNKTVEMLKRFEALFKLRFSATHRPDRMFNLLYRLDAVDAYNQQLVKRIAVKGITINNNLADRGYLYLERLNVSEDHDPTAILSFDYKAKDAPRKVTRKVAQGAKIYELSNHLSEYDHGYTITEIRAQVDGSGYARFANGIELNVGESIGAVDEATLRRIQIRETIKTHLDREQQLYGLKIKVLSLFFIDSVAKYRLYDHEGKMQDGEYVQIFQEEYANLVALKISHLERKLEQFALQREDGGLNESEMQQEKHFAAYLKYLKALDGDKTHAGYFSVDKHGRMAESKGSESNNVSDFELIMRSKELLLDLDVKKSPVRFIFSHSALREGWDNPNVFQICTLKQSNSEIRKRQEVGRGLRLCVNYQGVRQDQAALGERDVHDINVLTVVASESYESFASQLQVEILESLVNRSSTVDINFLQSLVLEEASSSSSTKRHLSLEEAQKLIADFTARGYVSAQGELTSKYHQAVASDLLEIPQELQSFKRSLVSKLTKVVDRRQIKISNARRERRNPVKKAVLQSSTFKELWERISPRTFYNLNFSTDELVTKAIDELNMSLHVRQFSYVVKQGQQQARLSESKLSHRTSFTGVTDSGPQRLAVAVSKNRYDLLGMVAEGTDLTRATVARILSGIAPKKFDLFKENPEEFILNVCKLINTVLSNLVTNGITYTRLDQSYPLEMLLNSEMLDESDIHAQSLKKHVFDYIKTDSKVEQRFVSELELSESVAMYLKLPKSFHIDTPMGHYTPDWAIVFEHDQSQLKHVFFVAETKGSTAYSDLRLTESLRIKCANQHFAALNSDVDYRVVNKLDDLIVLG